MQKMILVITLLLLTTSASISVQAQSPEKKETDKKETTTADAWRQALPEGEQFSNTAPVVVMEESTDNVDGSPQAAKFSRAQTASGRRLYTSRIKYHRIAIG